ncbi:immunoglobulin superfamily member 10 [Tachysurus ichikawai]
MDWLAAWIKRNPGVLKCKRDRKLSVEQMCPMCDSPLTSRGNNIIYLSSQAYTCSKPWIHSRLKQRNITMEENSYTQVLSKDFVAPIGLMEMKIVDQYNNNASVSCVVQRPGGLENLNVTQGVVGENVTTFSATVSTSLVCNIDYDHIRQLWGILASYSDSPMRLERQFLLTMSPEMIYTYKQARTADPELNEMFTEIEAEIKANPAWLLQGTINLQLDLTTTTYSTLHVKYFSNIEINIESNKVRRDRFSWTMIKKDNQTKTEFSVLSGGVSELNCETFGDPKPSIEWILPDGIKVRAPYSSEDRRIVILDNGKLTLKAADSSDSGIYHCIATNYLDADVLSFRVTVLSPDVEEEEVNGVQHSQTVGGSLVLDCETNGTPQATVHWILPDHTVVDRPFGNRKIYPNGNPEPAISWKRFSPDTGTTLTIKGKLGKFEVFRNGTLLIQNANVKDRGQYVCLAENAYGSDKLTVMLSVVAYPSWILEAKVREIKVHSGEKVELKCKTEGRPVPVVAWILANRTQVRAQNNGHGRVNVTKEGTLVIQQISIYDRGYYKCIASNPAGIDTATVRLQVVAAPPGILEEKRQLLRAEVGQSVWMPCTAQGDPQPTTHWVLMDGSVVMPLYSSSRVYSFPNGTLHLKNLDVSDSGKYECIATSSTGSERRVVTLSVEKTEIAPEIIETSGKSTELAYGSQLRLNCSATGIPKPKIIWRLPSKALVDQWHRMGSRIQVLENGTVIIDSVSDKDAGDYLCVARSNAGDDLQLMKVFVSMKPAKIEPKFIGKKQVPYGKDLKVDCKASGAPVPEISWGLPDGTLVNNALQADGVIRSRSKRYILFDNGTLYLNRVGMDEEGDYTCYAENTLGKDEMHVQITVVSAAPRIRPSPLNYAKVKPGGNVRFDCEAIGEPKPKILWMLPLSDMIAASNERYLIHVNGSIDIRNVKLSDAGEYVCIARNAAGDESKVYKLEIDGNPPIINGYYQNKTVVKDTAEKYSRKFIDCKAEGDPPPKITWIMPDNIFLTAPYYGSRVTVHYNGTLEIRNVRPTDTAEFICIARNDGGESVLVIHLEVTNQLMRPIFKNPFNERLMTRLGKTTVLNCSADGNPPPDMIWTLPNGTQLIGRHMGSHHHLGSDGTFVIHNPSKGDAGKYRCAAKNKIGYIEKLIILEVGQKPYILTRPKGIIRSVSGEPLFLHCLADGNPRPNILWTVPGGHVISRSQITGRYQLMDNGTLVIHQTNLHDRGNYMCRAKNNVGDALLTVPVIIVAYTPRITNGPPPNVSTTTGTPVQLSCIAVGIPKPEITWELPDRSVLSTAGKGRSAGSELLHPSGTLIIQKPTRADSGTYKCLATNHLGTDTRVTFLTVI